MKLEFSELKKKDVIDVCSGKKLGKIKDVTIAFPQGKVINLIVSSGKVSIFTGCEDIAVPICDIERIGDDAVLVKNKKQQRKAENQDCCYPTEDCFSNDERGMDFEE